MTRPSQIVNEARALLATIEARPCPDHGENPTEQQFSMCGMCSRYRRVTIIQDLADIVDKHCSLADLAEVQEIKRMATEAERPLVAKWQPMHEADPSISALWLVRPITGAPLSSAQVMPRDAFAPKAMRSKAHKTGRCMPIPPDPVNS
jgi:hypothetical protein